MATIEGNLQARIDELEARLNGLLIYLAAERAGVTLDLKNEDHESFIRSHTLRHYDHRLQQTGVKAGDGFHEAQSIARLSELSEELKSLKG